MPSRADNSCFLQRVLLCAAAAMGLLGQGAGARAELVALNLADLSFEELSKIEITSVSKRGEPLSEAPASVFVITTEDIRRSGAASLPEALRLAPNLQVSRESASGYVITARGFNAPNSNKLLVLIDGRSVYTPLFSGVFWDVQDVMLEDVERIEVLSGPGGTLWGTNAVNGVINIITRPARDTQGAWVTAGAGNQRAEAALRFGGAWGDAGRYRLYAKHVDHQRSDLPGGQGREDDWYKSQLGFRADWRAGRDEFSAQANAYEGAIGQPQPGTFNTGVPLVLGTVAVSGANLLARWTRPLDEGAGFSLQAYYDHTERVVPPTFGEVLGILDVQFQHALKPLASHTLAWGADYRRGRDCVDNGMGLAFLPARVTQEWISLFAQDDIRLARTLQFTLGVRLERNDYTGTEFLPNARLAWKPAADHLLWTAVSRTARSPSRVDRDIFVPAVPPYLLGGGPGFQSELAKVYELGYRGQPTPRISYSATAFQADYSHLRTLEFDTSGGAVVVYRNRMRGRVRGLEMWGTWQAFPALRLGAGYTVLDKKLSLEPGSADLDRAAASEGSDPKHRLMLRASLDLSADKEMDVMVRRVSALSRPQVPSYTVVDLRVGWTPRPDLEVSLAVQNLLGRRHTEYEFIAPHRSEFGRAAFIKVTGRF